ncbi:MAG: hypothetical protein JW861_09985, partial [Bacteroidales bacterium]|nr:hypothetical protein [Bacteroidales bacterium]
MMMWLVLQPPIASPQYTFRNINENYGLSSNECVCLIKDRQEFVWIGTRNGLNRFDGSECIRFLNDPLDSTSLSDNFIRSLYEDHRGRIWVGTRTGGLNV